MMKCLTHQSRFVESKLKVKNLKALKNPQPCKEINTIYYNLDIFKGLISLFSIGSVI